ncbi:efflux RND transporter permease subunit [Catelliglobosispora koreensis]|uniref:efflux RND transporter permease subunit n=1 Tax=Catelliglobosispora koreensis TaxID=129052 RepID=UPI000374AE7C|nr:efflux RND transporter permease subunit [Catelliglobosispora koreensis]
MSFLARLSLANRGLVALITIAILGFGVATVPQLRQQMLPDLQFPSISVIASYPGATPEIVEQQVSIPIEQAVSGIDGVTMITSASRNGSSTVWVNFDYGVDVKDISADIEQALSRIDSRLPANVDPTVFAGTSDDLPVIVLAASGGDDEALAKRLRDKVVPELNKIDGVREATVNGARTRQVTISLDPVALAAKGLTIQSVTTALTANGVASAGGVINENGLSYSVAIGGRFTSLDQIRELYLAPPAAPAAAGQAPKATVAVSTVQLKEIAKVESVATDATTLTRTNGQPSVGVSVTAIPGSNVVAISQAINEKLPELKGDGELTVIFDQAPEVERSIESLTTEGLLGLLFAVLVILFFLLSVRSTLVTAVSIPVSVVIALIALWMADYSLNILTLGGLTIAIGRVVDDSIVVLENIKRHLAGGEEKKHAILTAVKEVAGAVTASTLTTVAVFLPIALVGGFVGQIFGPFGLTVTAALLASLIVSLTIVPVMAYWFVKPPKTAKMDEAEANGRLQRAYTPVLRWSLKHRAVTLLLALLIAGGTGFLATQIDTSFIGGSGTTLNMSLQMPSGTSLATTDAAAKKIEQILADSDDVTSYQATVGGGGNPFGGGGGNTARASFNITIKETADRQAVIDDLRTKAEALGKDVGEVTVGGAGGGGGGFGSSNLEVEIQAGDEATLRAATKQVRDAVAGLADVTDVKDDLAANTEQVQITLNRAAAANIGLTDASVGQFVGQAFRGTQISRLVVDGVEQPVVLRTGAAPADLNALKALPIGPGLKLGDVAKVEIVGAPGIINRVDEVRTASVTATPTTEALNVVNQALSDKLKSLALPAGATYTIGGVTQSQAEAFGDLGLAMVVAIGLVFLVMIATFRGIVQPLILMVSIPFAATGSLGMLFITGQPLDLPAMIGLLMLIGIVVTNAIVLLDLINQYRKSGVDTYESIIEGGKRRLRPILMTAVATIFALLPMAFGLTDSSAFISQPLAVVVIGGLVTSTLLTLVLVPVLYSLAEGFKGRVRRKPAATPEVREPATV